MDAEAGGRFFAGPVQVGVQAGYQDMPQYLFFERATAAEGQGFTRGFAALRYGEAEVWYAGGSFSVVLPGGFHAVLGATYRNGQLTEEIV